MEESNRIETSTNFLEIKGDILYIIVKDNADLDLDAMKEAVAARRKIQYNKKMLVFVDTRNMWQLTKEANQYSASKEVAELSLAMAILTDSSLPKRLMANFFIKFNKLYCPTKLFNTEKKALAWLANFRKPI